VALEAQNPDDLVWIRGEFLNSEAPFGKMVVHGHTPSPEPVLRQNRIGVDTGACFTGRLTALRLEGRSRRFLQT
jgi:serine/threonine protein phosphatase 1